VSANTNPNGGRYIKSDLSNDIIIPIDYNDPFISWNYPENRIKPDDTFYIYALINDSQENLGCDLYSGCNDKPLKGNKSQEIFDGKLCNNYTWELSNAGSCHFTLKSGKYTKNITILVEEPVVTKDNIWNIVYAFIAGIIGVCGGIVIEKKKSRLDPPDYVIRRETKARLDELKRYPGENYDDLIDWLASMAKDYENLKIIEEALEDLKRGLCATEEKDEPDPDLDPK